MPFGTRECRPLTCAVSPHGDPAANERREEDADRAEHDQGQRVAGLHAAAAAFPAHRDANDPSLRVRSAVCISISVSTMEI